MTIITSLVQSFNEDQPAEFQGVRSLFLSQAPHMHFPPLAYSTLRSDVHVR